mmetsp:Transcript_9260/g.17441  ORF Transcript_9260/g.17441 Transcript_9260/m.17441 type:complete len:876 (-) Transcript_9260:3776-6403(-)
MNHDCFTIEYDEYQFLCDEMFASIVSYLDFKSAVIFTTRTSHRLERRIFGSRQKSPPRCFDELWREIFNRHYFSPVEYLLLPDRDNTATAIAIATNGSCSTNTTSSNDTASREEETSHDHVSTKRFCGIDYLDHCYRRLALMDNLTHEQRCRYNVDMDMDDTWKYGSSSYYGRRRRRRRTNESIISSSLAVPGKCFHFLPIVPSYSPRVLVLDQRPDFRIDFPSVDFPCSSYHLTSPGVEGEYIFLNPFDGEVAVFPDIETHHQEYAAMVARTELGEQHKMKKKETLFGVEDYFQLNLHEYFYRNNDNGIGTNTPFQGQALSVDEEVVVDWMGVDVHNIVDAKSGNITGNMICAAREISVDSRMMTNNVLEPWNGNNNEHGNNWMFRSKSCTELIAWKKLTRHDKYSDARYTCRLDGSPYFMEVCPVKDRVYTCFSSSSSWYEHPSADDANESVQRHSEMNSHNGEQQHHVHFNDESEEENLMMDLHDDVTRLKRSRCIRLYPLLRHVQSTNDDKLPSSKLSGRRFFPDVQQRFWCKYPVASLAIEPTGEHLIVGTENGTIEIWNVQKNEPFLVQRTDLSSQLECVTNASVEDSWMESMTVQVNSELYSESSSDTDGNERLERLQEVITHEIFEPLQRRVSYASSALDHLNESIVRDENTSGDEIDDISQPMRSDASDEYMIIQDSSSTRPVCQCNPRRVVNEIIISRHLSIRQAGFVTLQHHRDEGTTVALWLFDKQRSSFTVSSLVNLPLSTQRRPTVLYDGKKLVVFGQDHIGLIILIYRVISSPEDLACNVTSPVCKGKSDSSGGAVNLNAVESIVYMNRIRHAALGGLEYYDNMLMTMNERYIMVNTKTGNLLDGGNSETDGLLVIDLQL